MAGLRRVALAAITFLTSLLMAVILVLSGLLLEWIIGFSVDTGTRTHSVITFALDVTLVGCAVIWAIMGAVIVTWEAVVAARDFLTRAGKYCHVDANVEIDQKHARAFELDNVGCCCRRVGARFSPSKRVFGSGYGGGDRLLSVRRHWTLVGYSSVPFAHLRHILCRSYGQFCHR